MTGSKRVPAKNSREFLVFDETHAVLVIVD
jgi:hypothetical protein